MNRNFLAVLSVFAFSASAYAATNRHPAAVHCSDAQLTNAANKALADPGVVAKLHSEWDHAAPFTWQFDQVLSTSKATKRSGTQTITVSMTESDAQDFSINVLITAKQGCTITDSWVNIGSLDGG